MRRLLSGLSLAVASAFAFPSFAAPPALPPAPPNGKGDAAALLAATDDIARQVTALRGLKQLRPFGRGVLGRDAIGQRLRERIGKEYTPEEIRVEARMLKRLGLLPDGTDYEKLLVEILMDQVAGFYDPIARQLYIADWLNMEMQRPALAHEIQHALQDQHFDLKKFATPLKEDGDRQLARAALVEGDGTAVMLEFVAQSMGMDVARLPEVLDQLGEQIASGALGTSPVFERAPRFLRETLLFPYLGGMKFVMALRRDAPWSRIDAAFKDPPDSTEQVLHPKKYLARERPIPIVAAPIAALAPSKELRRDVLGELEWRVLLATRLPDDVAERSAAGWGGDRIVVYGAPGDGPVALVSLSAWDSEDDAIQVDGALRRLLPKQLGQPEKSPDLPPIYVAGGDAWSVERQGRMVLALFGVPEKARAAVADEVWKKWKVGAARPAK